MSRILVHRNRGEPLVFEFKHNHICHLIVKPKYLSAELYDEQWSRQITIFVSFTPTCIWVTFSLSISKQTYLNRECNRLGMSTLQGTFSFMRISDQNAFKILSFSVSSVISYISPYFLGIFKYVNTLERWSSCGRPRYYFEAISDMEPRCYSGQSLQKTFSPFLYFKIILDPVSVFLRNYFFLLTASGQKLFRKKTPQTAHGGLKYHRCVD